MNKQHVEFCSGKFFKSAMQACADKMKELIDKGYHIVGFEFEQTSYGYIILYEDGEKK